MKKLEYEQPRDPDQNPPEAVGRVEVGGGQDGTQCVGVPEDALKFTPPQPKGSSITLEGSGRHDGSDINNSLSLLDMYNLILRDRAKQRRDE